MIRSSCNPALLLLTLGLSLSSLAGCGDSASSAPVSLRILVTNDDGVGAEGIDAVAEALRADPLNEVTVCGPAENQSASGDMTDCGTGAAIETTTQSGYPATAVDGCPADSVNYALDTANGLYEAGKLPHLVISGINEGQNLGESIAGSISRTVGAAKTAARDHGVPALASSQGSSLGAPIDGAVYDYDAGVEAVLAWLAEHRSTIGAGNVTTSEVANLNIPTCVTGSIRGGLELPLTEGLSGALEPQDCESTVEDPQTDTEGFNNGFITLSPVPAD